jgi:transcriptional regulator with XRE-family HTH domain
MSFPERLKEERKRLRLTQPQLADIGQITKGSQLNYEKGISPASSNYLELVAEAGIDVQYLLTGIRSETELVPEEKYLLTLYREASPPLKKAAVAALASGVQRGGITIEGGNVGNIVNGVMTGGTVIVGR